MTAIDSQVRKGWFVCTAQSLWFDRSDKYFQDNMWNLRSYRCLIYSFNVAQLIEGVFSLSSSLRITKDELRIKLDIFFR